MLVSLRKPGTSTASSSGRVEVKRKKAKLPVLPTPALENLDAKVETEVNAQREEIKVKVEWDLEDKVEDVKTSPSRSIPCKEGEELLPQNPSTLIQATAESKGKQKLRSDAIAREDREEQYKFGPNWVMTVQGGNVGQSNPSSSTPNEKSACPDDTDILIRDPNGRWKNCDTSLSKMMPLDEIMISYDHLAEKVTKASEIAEGEQWELSDKFPDLASDLGSLKLISKNVYVNLVKAMDVTTFLHTLAPQLAQHLQSIETKLGRWGPVIEKAKRVDELTKRLKETTECAKGFERLAGESIKQLRSSAIHNHFKTMHLQFINFQLLEELDKLREETTKKEALPQESLVPSEQISIPLNANVSDGAVLEETLAPSDQLSHPLDAQVLDGAVLEENLAPSDQLSLPLDAQVLDGAVLEETLAPSDQLSLPFDAHTSDETVVQDTLAPSDQLPLPLDAQTSDERVVEDTLAPSD
jgi:hypothetical protein